MNFQQVSIPEDKQIVRILFLDYLKWVFEHLNQEYDLGIEVDTAESYVDTDMETLDKFLPPLGRLILTKIDGESVAIAGLRRLDNNTLEIKRMYVDPNYRNQGIGRSLLNHLIEIAYEEKASRLRLDSARFMKPAHDLYRSVGFKEIDPYEGSEIEKEIQHHWIFMELKLSS